MPIRGTRSKRRPSREACKKLTPARSLSNQRGFARVSVELLDAIAHRVRRSTNCEVVLRSLPAWSRLNHTGAVGVGTLGERGVANACRAASLLPDNSVSLLALDLPSTSVPGTEYLDTPLFGPPNETRAQVGRLVETAARDPARGRHLRRGGRGHANDQEDAHATEGRTGQE